MYSIYNWRTPTNLLLWRQMEFGNLLTVSKPSKSLESIGRKEVSNRGAVI